MASPIPSRRSPKRNSPSRAKTATPSSHQVSNLTQWKLEDAKARFSELVRQANKAPQLVTLRGKEAAVILDPETYRQLLPPAEKELPLSEFLRGLELLGEIDIERERDTGRDLEL